MVSEVRLDAFAHRLSPMLQADGFGGSNGIWRRSIGEVIDCVELQLKSDESACCVNLGVHFAFLPPVGKSQVMAASSLSVADCEIKSRLAWMGEADHWWTFENAEKQADDLVSCYKQIGRAFFQRFDNFPQPFASLKSEDVTSEATASFFPTMTKVRKYLLLARIQDHLGNAEAVVQLCNTGIENAGMASGPKAAFRDLLRKYKA